MGEPRGVTLQKAGELLGGDKPLSKRTISAMIARGDLEVYGTLGGRRVTLRSIRAYQDGRRGQWHGDETDESPIPATPLRRKQARGTRFSPGLEVDTTSEKVSIVAHRPKRGLIRS